MRFYSLVPAYGRDYKNAKDAKQAFMDGKDFEGDMQLGFKLVGERVHSLRPCSQISPSLSTASLPCRAAITREAISGASASGGLRRCKSASSGVTGSTEGAVTSSGVGR